MPNTFQGMGIAGISSLGVFNAARYTELIDAYFDTRKQSGFIAPTVLLPRQRTILDLLNVKYVVTYDAGPEQRIELEAAGLVAAFSDRRFAVHRNPTAWPRAFVVHDHHVVADRPSAIRAAGSSTSDVAIVEERPGFPAGGPATRCQIIHYGANEIRVVGNDASAGMLVVLDSFVRGGPPRSTASGRRLCPLMVRSAVSKFLMDGGKSDSSTNRRSFEPAQSFQP